MNNLSPTFPFGFVALTWLIRERLWHAWVGLTNPYRPGCHRFVRGRCLCGHTTKNDPKRCTLWRTP